ncbi:fungal hydrophobin-domain-containing protein [Schizophyllum commune]
MKLVTFFAFLFAMLFAVSAVPTAETNADRMRRGLTPMRPRNLGRATPADTASKHKPSGGGGNGQTCSSGPVQCCQSVQKSNSGGLLGVILKLLGIVLGEVTDIGLHCTPINVLGGGGNQCSAQTVCCKDNSYSGHGINIGCSPINIGL